MEPNQQQQAQQQGTQQQSQNSDNQQAAAGGDPGAQQQQQQSGAGSAATAAPPGMSPEQISALVKSAVGEVAQVSQPQETPEQQLARFERAFNVHKFDADKLARMGYSEEQIATVMPLYEEMRDGFVRQAVTMSNYQLSLLKDELMKQFAPALEVARQHQENLLKAEFLETNKDLKGFEPLLEEIKNRLVAQKATFRTKEELFTSVATQARNIIKSLQTAAGNGGGGGSATAGQQTQQRSHSMSTVATGGQGGAGGQAASGDKPGWLKALE